MLKKEDVVIENTRAGAKFMHPLNILFQFNSISLSTEEVEPCYMFSDTFPPLNYIFMLLLKFGFVTFSTVFSSLYLYRSLWCH